MAMVKSGWLHRQSTILRRWKRNWFDLWADGRLVFFNDQQRCDMEDELHMRVDCINIRGAAACPELNAPEAKVRDALFQIVCRDGRVVSLCAESADDALAWTMALQDARINTVVSTPQVTFAQEVRPSAPPPYSDYAPPPQVRGLTCMNVSSCTHTIYTRYRRGHVEESVVVSDAFTWCTCGLCSGPVRGLRGGPPAARRPDRVLARRAALRRGLPLPVPRCVRRPWGERRRDAGAAVGGRGGRGSGDARRSCNRFGHRLPLCRLLVMEPPPPRPLFLPPLFHPPHEGEMPASMKDDCDVFYMHTLSTVSTFSCNRGLNMNVI
uniref:Pleckstrin homology domain containing, family B (evectins) member 2 n=1 Tax=Gasterosteus aculeatus aculeatus TaxID=481459 RepID=G3PAH9_GASAC